MQRRPDTSYLLSPTDLVNFLGCAHATVLDLRAFLEPLQQDEASEGEKLLRRKGDEHEAAYLQRLQKVGKSVAVIPKYLRADERTRITIDAMQRGAEAIYQAALVSENWQGFADFLVKTDTPSTLGAFSYEVTDTKLARRPQVKHLIQLGVYSRLLTNIQGTQPAEMQLVLGDNRDERFLVKDFASYVHHAMQRLESFSNSPPPDSYPEPCAHCTNCHWKDRCKAQWETDDHLSLVANIQQSQISKLERADIATVAQLAKLRPTTRIPDMNPEVFERLRAQAALQMHKRTKGENKFERIACEPGRGFSRLPPSNPGDLFFDMEGDPLHPEGLEYLFGVCFWKKVSLTFRPFWAHDHTQERVAFAAFMEFLREHLDKHPDAYIYHYNHYETTALKRLACRYATAEHQLDDLLRRMKFVDLYKVVREAIRISEPGYSIKYLETFYMPPREGEVTNAGDSVVAYNRWRETGELPLLQQIADYNEVDCISTAKLRDWLLQHRPAATPWFDGPPPASDAKNAAARNADRIDREKRYADFQQRLLETATGPEAYRRHLADLLEFHAREGRPQWWEFFDRQNRFDDELLDDTECLAGLTLVGQPEPVKRSLLHTFRFPPQETKRKAGDQVFDVATLVPAGTIEAIDDDHLTVQIKRGTNKGPLPETLTIGPGGPINSDALREAIYRVAEAILAGNQGYTAVRDILKRAKPRIQGRKAGQPIVVDGDPLAATVEAVAGLTDSYLFIQGPPGAGKTFTSAHVIVELIRRGKKVGVAANSHKAIHNLLDMIESTAEKAGVPFAGVKKTLAGNPETSYDGKFIHSQDSSDDIDLTASLLAGTAWLFANERFDRHLDYLFIDEAGQVSVANVVAMGTAARNIVLVGDQMQLGQPIQGVHPGEAGSSILEFLLGHRAAVAADRGIFLNRTRRLHPKICRFISDAYYEGRLTPDPDNAKRKLAFKTRIEGIAPEGIHFLPVTHGGCSQKCEEEGRTIQTLFKKLVGQQFTDKDGSTRNLTTYDILVVSPYNVQVNYLKSILPPQARVGTVDKFQGQEAPIVLLSMVTSDAECLPRDIDFLFSLNRMNVALSRAQCLAIVVASPRLLEVPCRTLDQLKLISSFCRLVEYASGNGGDCE